MPETTQERSVKNVYDPQEIEARWQGFWEEHRTFRAPNPGEPDFDADQPKYYVLDMFPYPSGAGLHVGHPMGYIGSDIVTRKKRMEGFNVLHPMGYDAFGLPAEQYAIQTGQHPAKTTEVNVATYRRQLKLIGLSYDWSREFATSTPDYYRWTQWIFARLYDRGLAYQTEVPVWWCEGLKTVLSNEEVIGGRSERGDHPCVRRPLKQWMLKITAYADRLLDDLGDVDWPESVKTMQREWIGRSEGAEIEFAIADHEGETLKVFTTRPDTLYGATFMVVAPEHPLVAALVTDEQSKEVEAYVQGAAVKSDLERTDLAKDKTGVFLGAYGLNPMLDAGDPEARVPIYVADYVLMGYGTGAIMAVPAHDERDFEYAQKFGLPIRPVVRPVDGDASSEGCTSNDGVSVNSPAWDGMPTEKAKPRSIAVLEKRGCGAGKTTYRLRDWLFSRQRYWGEPFPVLHHADGSTSRVPDEALPVELPEMQDFAPPEDGSPPLSKATDWVNTTHPSTDEPVLRDTDTMPGWAGSCWYYLRFMDAHNDQEPFSHDAVRYWQNVDLYIGGTEHAVLHLLYARFWHKVLYDEGLVPTKEPFQKLFNQGMLTAYAYKDPTGRLVPVDEVEFDGDTAKSGGQELEQVIAKMSKSLRNVVNPDEVCKEYGVDTFRLYEMFMGPLSDSKPWNPRDVPGCRRFLDRVWRIFVDEDGTDPVRPQFAQADAPPSALEGDTLEVERALNRCLKRVDDAFKHFNFNTAIAAFMSFLNEAKPREAITRDQAERFVRALSPFAPHVSEELWSRLGHDESVARAPWPEVREEFLVEDQFELVVQILGKVRGRAQASKEASKDDLEEIARAAVAEKLDGREIVKTIVVPGRLVNFVVK
ncbi:MAG: leucine--tRNA ligase [bacterium]|nr:leucine--tRNA ligase [bacterium]